MDMFFWARTFDVVGKVLLGITVLSVHWNVIKEHRIDKDVLSSMKREIILGVLGIIFIIIGYILEIVFLY